MTIQGRKTRPQGVEQLCTALAREPLFHMSLGSKELFHSNVIAWLADSYPAIMAEVMSPWCEVAAGAGHEASKREKGHLDVVLRLPGTRPLVIENKMFAIPNPDQLRGYDAAVEEEAPGASRLLLALMPTGPLPPGWASASYGELARRLSAAVPQLAARDLFDGDILSHYVSMIDCLDQLMAMVGVPELDEPLPVPDESRAPLRTIRVETAFQKSRVSAVAADVRQSVADRGWDDSQFLFDSGMTRGMALVSAYRRIRDDEYLGWQIQGDQFRLAVKVGSAHRGNGRVDREAYARATYTEWFDFSPLYEVAPRLAELPPRRGDQARFNSYEPDFAYLYVRCRGITRSQIVEAGTRYLERAGEYLE